MAKPATLDGYSDHYTVDCERVLMTLLRGLGPWKESVFLVRGLTPRYLVAARPPALSTWISSSTCRSWRTRRAIAPSSKSCAQWGSSGQGTNEARGSRGGGRRTPKAVRLWWSSCSQMHRKSLAARLNRFPLKGTFPR